MSRRAASGNGPRAEDFGGERGEALRAETTSPLDRPATKQRRWRPVLILTIGLALFMALDWVVFGWIYLRWVAPQSAIGTILTVARTTEEAAGVNGGVLVFGNSRVGEGFSAKLANAEAERLGASQKFFNSAVPGTAPRVWYYLLREYRDRGLHPAAVVFMSGSPQDSPGNFNPDAVSSIPLLSPFLRWSDAWTFPLSFRKPAARFEALEAVLFKGWLLQRDVADFLTAPEARLQAVEASREHGAEALYDYPGNPATLAGLSFDPATGEIGWPPGADKLPQNVRAYIDRLKADRGDPAPPKAAKWAHYWYASAAELCRQMGAKMIVFRVPRGPLHFLAAPQREPYGPIADLAAAGDLQAIPADAFVDLERPEFFYDDVHMNHAGREVFSPRLAREILRILAR